ncbi:MAG: cupin [Candidatus Firestonebacteria bacterium]|nr:cupin [Candidatus Firestonebacteria bacterium]
MKTVNKPWGKEELLAHNNKYAFKILCVNKGHRLSLQYHQKKIETMYVANGILKVTKENNSGNLEEIICKIGSIIDIPAGIKHRIEALEDCTIFEASTPELDDVVRLEDDYKRL